MGESLLKRIIESLKGSRFVKTKVGDFVYGVLSELDAVTWPTKQEVYNSTIVVLITVVVFSIYSGLWDFIMKVVRGWFFSILR